MHYIANAFSLQMVAREHLLAVRIEPCHPPFGGEFRQPLESIVGHADTARVLGVEFNRRSVQLEPGDVMYVAQLVGGRLPEGATSLPEGARFEWVQVTICRWISDSDAESPEVRP